MIVQGYRLFRLGVVHSRPTAKCIQKIYVQTFVVFDMLLILSMDYHYLFFALLR